MLPGMASWDDDFSSCEDPGCISVCVPDLISVGPILVVSGLLC